MPRVLSILLALAAAGGVAGCAANAGGKAERPGPSPGDHNLSMLIDGVRRDYTVHAPPAFGAGNRYPVILMFHGSGQTRDDMVRLTKLNPLADKESLLIVYMGYKGAWDMSRDKPFVTGVLDQLAAKWGADPQRTYAAGFSMGAIFVNDLAVELPDRLRAVAAVGGGSRDIKAARAAKPVPLLAIQGDKDRARQSFTVSNMEWNTWAACGNAVREVLVPDRVNRITTTCAEGSKHVVIDLIGVSHEWPNGEGGGYAIDAANLMWQFFQAS